ncbi:hypothetical protein [Kribbella sp. DT2]|uniref:hypothetical protein n=1 Tax=Kribbella sp. DT2 TaxID=3393427 RepID=UPI003CEFD694
MKARALGALVGVAAVLSGLLVASPAQAASGSVYARVYYPNPTGSGGEASADLNFTGRSKVTVRYLKVRDICPGDNRPVRAVVVATRTDGSRVNISPYYSDTNGCGADGTQFPTVKLGLGGGQRIKSLSLKVCVYTAALGNVKCVTSSALHNPYT